MRLLLSMMAVVILAATPSQAQYPGGGDDPPSLPQAYHDYHAGPLLGYVWAEGLTICTFYEDLTDWYRSNPAITEDQKRQHRGDVGYLRESVSMLNDGYDMAAEGLAEGSFAKWDAGMATLGFAASSAESRIEAIQQYGLSQMESNPWYTYPYGWPAITVVFPSMPYLD